MRQSCVSSHPPHRTRQYSRIAETSLPRASASGVPALMWTTFSAGVSASGRLTSFPLGHLFTETTPHTLPVSNSRHNEQVCKQSFVHECEKTLIPKRRSEPPEHGVAPGRISTVGGICPSHFRTLPLRDARQRLTMQNLCASPKARPGDDRLLAEVNHDQLAHFVASSAAVSGLGATLQ